MASGREPNSDASQPVDEVLREYLQEMEAGLQPDRQKWLDRHPEMAAELTEFFIGHDTVEKMTALLRTASPDMDQTAAWDAGGAISPGDDARKSKSGPLRFGDYEDLKEIGRGAMGVIYRARQKSLKRTVALKMILAGDYASEKDRIRFRAEAEAVASLQNPHIVQIHEVGEYEGRPFFSLEYLAGGSLKEKLDGTPWLNEDAASFVETLARAIHTAHQRGIVHRDLKPGNVLLSESGSPKISDFGLALRLDEVGGQSSGILGTPAYMAPEQARGNPLEIGPAADVYALGAIVYELLTGRSPFTAATPLDIVIQVVSVEPVAPRLLNPRVDRDLETICLACLKKEPHRRYASALHLAEDLARYLRRDPIQARPIGITERTWRWCRKYPSRAGAIGISLAAVVVVLTLLYTFNRRLQHEQNALHMAFTTQVAERLDNQCHDLCRLPQTIAAGLSLRSDWTEEQLKNWMHQLLKGDQRGFGITVAFEPGQFEGRKEFALYIYREPTDGTYNFKHLLPPDYKPHYSLWDWYKEPKDTARPTWSSPFLDVGGGNVWMITYTAPILRGKGFAGVVTVDLQPDFFVEMGQLLQGVNLGRSSHGFVISRDGVFLSHPDPTNRMPKNLRELAGFNAGEPLNGVLEAARKQESGVLRGTDPHTGNPARFLYAPVSGPGWLFVAVIED